MHQSRQPDVDPDSGQAIETAAESLKKAIESNDAVAINRAMEELTQAQHKAAASLYQQAAPGGAGSASNPPPGSGPEGGASAGSGQPSPGDVIDAEVVDEGKP